MTRRIKPLLFTGPPGVGKSTAVRKVTEAIGLAGVHGLYSGEIRIDGKRQGQLCRELAMDREVTELGMALLNREGRIIIEQAFSDLENGPLAHLPSGRFNANTAWLTLAAAAFNLMRAAGWLAGSFHAKATGATLRRTLINTPARIATSARRIHLHLPDGWPWAEPLNRLLVRTGHRLATC